MADLSVSVEGIDALQSKLNRMENLGAVLRRPFTKTASDIQTYMKEYQPMSEANQPRPGHTYYKRGYGPIYVHVGGMTKKGNLRKGGWSGRKTSQMLNRSWSIRSEYAQNSARVTIGSRATYAKHVHWGPLQAGFHKRRNWRTVQAAAQKYQKLLVARVNAALTDELAKR
jgi:hypothetical protein